LFLGAAGGGAMAMQRLTGSKCRQQQQFCAMPFTTESQFHESGSFSVN
jgi:hypothetical protein